MEILETTNYKRFKTITGNRCISLTKVINIINDINEGFNMLPYCPILVTEKDGEYFIIDGQHRFEVSKRTKKPVYYVVCNDITLKQIATLNSRTDKWKATDFLHCYINLGIEDYTILKDFMIKYKVNIQCLTNLLMFNKIGKWSSQEAFRAGTFKVNYPEETRKLIELTESIFGRYVFSKDRYLIGAVQLICNKGICDWNRFTNKLNLKPNLMDKQTDPKGYILNIERIYNDGLSKRVLLT